MRRLLLLSLLWLPSSLFAQGIRFDSMAVGANGLTIRFPTVTVCSPTASGIPCSPTVTVYANSTLTTPCSANPLPQVPLGTTFSGCGVDALGNYGFWAAPGSYVMTVQSSQSSISQTLLILSGSLKAQVFTSSGTWTIPSGVVASKVAVVGGGGAGGGGGSTSGMGLGGGSGAAAIAYLSALTPGNTIAVTVGTGGTGVSAGNGNPGTASSIASGTQTITTVTANGGSGGTGNIAGVQAGAAGGTASGGTLNFSGNASMPGGVSPLLQTPGAPSIFGGAPQVNAAGGAPGAGGGGNQGNPSTGGAGANGIVIFEWVQ